MDKKTFKELWQNCQLKEVYEEIDDGWRHGNHMYTVFKHEDDYWGVNYSVSGDGEYHGIRDNDFEFDKVYPHTIVKVTTDYSTAPKVDSPTRYIPKFFEVDAYQFPGILPYIDEYSKVLADVFAQNLDALTKFEEWAAKYAGPDKPISIKYRGDKLVIISNEDNSIVEKKIDIVVDRGTWLIKLAGVATFVTMSDDNFKDLYQKA